MLESLTYTVEEASLNLFTTGLQKFYTGLYTKCHGFIAGLLNSYGI
jgi:hypothetical protein